MNGSKGQPYTHRACPGDPGLEAACWNATRLRLWEPTFPEICRYAMLFGSAAIGPRAGKAHLMKLAAEWARKQGLDVRTITPDSARRAGHRVGKRGLLERMFDEDPLFKGEP